MAATDDARARWNTRHAERAAGGSAPTTPAPFLTERADLLPPSGRALDVAGGAGRNALWLARRGLDVTLVDVSDVACEQASAAAEAAGLTLTVRRLDLSVEPVPPGPWDLVLVHHWLDRDAWRRLARVLAPGGVLLACQPTVRNLERHDRPPRRFLLDTGELHHLAADLAAAGDAEVVEATEGWTDEGRHEAHLVLRRHAPRTDR